MNRKINFAGLDGLRFISISFVVLHHLDTFLNYYQLGDFDLPAIGRIGYYGIQFFFAGSGFLITYLLLAEHEQNGEISIRNFYIRRILRIWPGYYLLIFLALVVVLRSFFFMIPDLTPAYLAGNYQKGNLLYFFFMPHIAPFYSPVAPYVHQTYTIGIEEQFYFIWGVLFLFAATSAKKIFIFLLILVPVLNAVHELCYDPVMPGAAFKFLMRAATFINYSRFSTFAAGALLAYAFYTKAKWLELFRKVYVQLLVYALLILSIWFDISIPFVRDEYIAIVMLAVFTVATFREDSIINYSAGWLSYLGNVSYGIYLFHLFAIVFSIRIWRDVFHAGLHNYFQLILLSLLTLTIATLLGWISYYAFERYFLRLKKHFSRV